MTTLAEMTALLAAGAGAVLRVTLGASGVAELDEAGGYDGEISAVLLDEAGEVCGRARRFQDPASARRYGPQLGWHVQLGGVLSSRRWAGVPMGCGTGDSARDAVAAAISDLRRQAEARERAAADFAAFF